jgi:probable rRNA maturation factor
MRWPGARPPAALDASAIAAALREFLTGLGHGRSGITVLFATDATLQRLNARHRGQPKSTDILSWSYLDAAPGGAPALLGELALSLDRARAQARANGWPLQTEVLRLLAHGCAHLAGYDHATAAQDRAMRRLEERLLARIGVRGLYPGGPGVRRAPAPPKLNGQRRRRAGRPTPPEPGARRRPG